MKQMKQTIFLLALIAMLGISGSALAAASFAGGTISPTSGSLADVLTGNSKVATITGTGLTAANVPAGSLQLHRTTAPLNVVALTIVGYSAAGDEVYVTIANAAGGNAGVYNVEFDPPGAPVLFSALAGITYELRRDNNNLQVIVKMTMKKRADITWAGGSGNGAIAVGMVNKDDSAAGTSFAADNIAAFTWIVRDDDLSTGTYNSGGTGYAIDVSNGATPFYQSSDNANGNKILRLKNVSKTNNSVDLYAQATDAVSAGGKWTLVQVAPTSDTFSLSAKFDVAAAVLLTHQSPAVASKAALAVNGTTDIVLTLIPPATVTVAAGNQFTTTVQITAIAP